MRVDIPDGLSDSPFAKEIGVGDIKLRFGSGLEAQYRQLHLRRMRLRIRLWYTCMAILAASFALAGMLSPGRVFENIRVHGVNDWFRLASDGICVPLLVWLAWSRIYQRLYLPIARIAIPIYAGTGTVVITQVILGGDSLSIAWLTLFVMATYFFSGLLFRAAAFCNVVAGLAFIGASVAAHAPAAISTRAMLVLTMTSLICAIVARNTEQISRRGFLEAALLEDYGARDSLTGLLNRRAFDEHLLRVWQQALRNAGALAVLMIDIDHFKAYNDTYGHQAGDAAIRDVAKALREFARRPLDLAARYGGEEFSIVLFDLSQGDVEDIAERARRAVASLNRSSSDESQRPITISIGIALVSPMIDRTPQGAIQLADEALYEAKAAGRNRVALRGAEEYRSFKTGSFRAAFGNRA